MVKQYIWPKNLYQICNCKPVIFDWLYEAINQWYTRTCLLCWNLFKVQWLGIRFSAKIYVITYLFTIGSLQVTSKEMRTLHHKANLTSLEE